MARQTSGTANSQDDGHERHEHGERDFQTVESPPLTYGSYLHLDEILSAQHPLGPESLGPQIRAAEHFFIVVHQTFELWFSQELLDLHCATDALNAEQPDPEAALDHLQRALAILRLLSRQMELFNHLSPAMFLAFRPYLGTASGSESSQYRQVQRALGLRGHQPGALYEGFQRAVERAGLTLEQIYRDPSGAGVLYRLAEVLVDISESFWLLTASHVQIADRAIGARAGTGGTSGVSYLAQALEVKAFPDLWDVRTRL